MPHNVNIFLNQCIQYSNSVKDAGTLPHVHRDASIFFNQIKQWIDAHERDAPKENFKNVDGPGNKITELLKGAVYIPHQFSHAVLNKSEVISFAIFFFKALEHFYSYT